MSKLISRTGRVQSWMDNPESRLPVSCTVMSVDDSMTGVNGIESSWRFVSHALRHGAGVAVHLSNLRPKGTVTTKGPDELVASGPVSFGRISVMALASCISTSTTLTHSNSFKPPDMNYPGLNAASISLKNPGMSSPTKKNSSKGFAKATSG
jgi:hypothetical protein